MYDKKLIIANWKMNGRLDESAEFIKSLNDIDPIDKEIVICPPFTLINQFKMLLITGKIGAQNCSPYENGSYTGEVSADMLADLGCEYVIIGHSERRKYQSESSEQIKNKIILAQKHGLNAILCIGENIDIRNQNSYLDFLKEQIKTDLPEEYDPAELIIAYEPLWAIGTGLAADSNQIEEICNFLTRIFENKVKIVYGGSVNENNIVEILKIQNCAGALIGNASLKIDQFKKIIYSEIKE